MIQVGDLCWKINAEGISVTEITQHIAAKVGVAVTNGESIQTAIEEGLQEKIGMDLYAPSDIARPGDTIATKNGLVEIDGGGGTTKELERFVLFAEELGIDKEISSLLCGESGNPLMQILTRENVFHAYEYMYDLVCGEPDGLRAQLGAVLETVFGNGCNSIQEGITQMKNFDTTQEKIENLYERIVGKPPEYETNIEKLVSDIYEYLGEEPEF